MGTTWHGRDIVVLAHLASAPGGRTVRHLAEELEMPSASVHRSLKTLQEAGLYFHERGVIARKSAHELLAIGMKYMFPPRILGEGRGVPTAWSASPIDEQFIGANSTYVWPHLESKSIGLRVTPLDPRVPELALANPALGELLALIDVVRIGGVRERQVASELIATRVGIRTEVAA